jgi:surface antigen
MIVHGAVSTLSIFILMSALMAVIPSGIAGGHRYDQSFFQPLVSIVMTKKAHTTLIAAQAATATAVTQDGYDPGGGHTYAGVQAGETNLHIPPMDWGSLNRFFYGQCTYWANMRYHIMTGHWIPWLGNAYQWAYQAPAYGWAISSTPNPNGPSIVILAPYAQGAGAYGHVAIVEKVNRDGSVVTSNWNWNGRWASESWVTFYPGRGVTFVWYPG